MKKGIKSWGCCLLFCLQALFFVACEKNEPINLDNIVGIWETYPQGDTIFVFNEDKTGYYEYSSSESFNYSCSANSVRMTGYFYGTLNILDCNSYEMKTNIYDHDIEDDRVFTLRKIPTINYYTHLDISIKEYRTWQTVVGRSFYTPYPDKFNCKWWVKYEFTNESNTTDNLKSIHNAHLTVIECPYWISATIDNNAYIGELNIEGDENTSAAERTGVVKVRATSTDSRFEPAEQSITITQAGSRGGSGGGNGGSSSTDPVWGKVTATADVTTTSWDSYLSWVDGQTCTIDYVYYPNTGKYYIYGGPFCSDPDANGGKGIRYEAHKGYNSIVVEQGRDKDYVYDYYYSWSVSLKFTIP